MLNAEAKEFVPAASPAAAPPKPDAASGAAPAASSCCDIVKAQLSPKAREFVPRGGAAQGSGGLDAASDPPRSVLDPPRSDSTLSSSVVSREADDWAAEVREEGCYGDEGYYGAEEQPCAAAAVGQFDGSVPGCYYYCDELQQPATPFAVVQGGEVAPAGPYDAYGYGGYGDGYGAQYDDSSCGDAMGGTVYYDAAAYDGSSTYPQGAYYWDDASGSYMYDNTQYGSWQFEGSAAESFPQPGDAAAAWSSPSGELAPADDFAGTTAASLSAVDSELSLEEGLMELVAAGGGGEVGSSCEQLRCLAPADTAELLELFFPHYAGAALARLLERTGGDLLAAFAELAAMERQVGAERAAAAGSSSIGRGRGGGGRGGGRAVGGRYSGGKRSEGGGSTAAATAAFKLDLESFPSLRSAARPQPSKAESPAAASPPDAEPTERVQHELCPLPTATAIITATRSTSCTSPSAPGSVPATLKPNFAALLRSSVAAGPSLQPPASESQQQQPVGGTSSAKMAPKGPAAVAFAAASSAAAAVPWVSTGEAVAAQYAEERREAAVLARARNKYFQQATLAFLAGDKALAKQLGRKGREMNEAMKAAHAAAARRIFAQRNAAHQQLRAGGGGGARRQLARQQQQQTQNQGPRSAAPGIGGGTMAAGLGGSGASDGGGGDALFVDLHGLHATEAVAALEAQIEQARAAGCRFLRVCTGTGHHTKGAKTPARLPNAVADTLLANHLTFKTLKPGLLEAQL